MPRPSEDDRERVDRAFADLVAGFHLTAERPDPPSEQSHSREQPGDDPAATEAEPQPSARNDAIPLTRREEPFSFQPPSPTAEPPRPDDTFVPEPPLPLPRPAWPVLVAWIAMGYAVLAVLAAAMGLRLPSWAGWLALLGFVGGFGLLVTRLPRHRPPDAGDGAVL